MMHETLPSCLGRLILCRGSPINTQENRACSPLSSHRCAARWTASLRFWATQRRRAWSVGSAGRGWHPRQIKRQIEECWQASRALLSARAPLKPEEGSALHRQKRWAWRGNEKILPAGVSMPVRCTLAAWARFARNAGAAASGIIKRSPAGVPAARRTVRVQNREALRDVRTWRDRHSRLQRSALSSSYKHYHLRKPLAATSRASHSDVSAGSVGNLLPPTSGPPDGALSRKQAHARRAIPVSLCFRAVNETVAQVVLGPGVAVDLGYPARTLSRDPATALAKMIHRDPSFNATFALFLDSLPGREVRRPPNSRQPAASVPPFPCIRTVFSAVFSAAHRRRFSAQSSSRRSTLTCCRAARRLPSCSGSRITTGVGRILRHFFNIHHGGTGLPPRFV